ncbi:MAG: hypothetical protein JXR07_19400 [Reichenbachiella sp.]
MKDIHFSFLKTTLVCVVLVQVLVAHSQSILIDTIWRQVFDTNCCGWTGGDGVYSIPLKDGRSIFIFGDTYLGEVKDDNSRANTSPAIKNSLVIYDEGKIETLFDQTGEKPKPFFQTNESDSTWYWPGHGYEFDGQINFFLSEFKATGSGVFGFEWVGTSIAQIGTKNIEDASPTIVKWEHNTDIHFGNATLVDKDYLYAFGIRAFQVYVARSKLGVFEWEYLSNGAWIEEANESMSLNGVYVSEQFSVFKSQDKFVILSQGAMLGKEIFTYTSLDLVRGWSKPKEIYSTKEPLSDSTLITYNALAHPQFINNDELLVSYCVNSTDFLSIYRDVDRYRPRFIRVPLRLILE